MPAESIAGIIDDTARPRRMYLAFIIVPFICIAIISSLIWFFWKRNMNKEMQSTQDTMPRIVEMKMQDESKTDPENHATKTETKDASKDISDLP